MIEQIVSVLTEVATWMAAQNVWAEPIVNFLIAIACIKYILFGWR